jgi:SAM-dependent methyltransferase
MTPSSRQEHWDSIYARKREEEVTWFEAEPTRSLELITRCALPPEARIIDVGGGASRLVDGLLDRGFVELSVLDVSSQALEKSRARLGARGANVRWITGDVTTFEPAVRYALWHDRAVFHFLTREEDRAAYSRVLERALAPGGQVIIGTFAADGPDRCSGLEVVRYDGASLAAALGPSFALVETVRHEHLTPGGKVQLFTFCRLKQVGVESSSPP